MAKKMKKTKAQKKQERKSKRKERLGIGKKEKKQAEEKTGNKKPEKKAPKEKPEDKGIRYIVRIAGKDLNGRLPIYRALTGIKGIGQRLAWNTAIVFEKESGIAYNSNLGTLNEEQGKKLEDVILHPEKHGIPKWSLNRRKDFESGRDSHLVMAELDFSYRKDLQRLSEIKSYRGLRRSWGLTVRGQHTKSTHRGKGGIVGVVRKDLRQQQEKKDKK